MMRKGGTRSLALGVLLALVLLAGVCARELEEDIEETWETVSGDVMVKLVSDLDSDAVKAARKLVRCSSLDGSAPRLFASVAHGR